MKGMSNMDKRFENITMTGRMCYIFMCIERYLLALYPDRDWTLVARKMWQWMSYPYWADDGWYEYGGITPNCVLKYKDYDDMKKHDGLSIVSCEEYDQARKLYDGITNSYSKNEMNVVLDIPVYLCNLCDGESYDDKTGDRLTLEHIDMIEGILEKHGIPLPDASLVAEYAPQKNYEGELDRWGFQMYGTEKLSIILKGNK
ncbi:MAG: hypothetical protein IKP51_05510 [Treponema sp.]|nr:hypothetical protein [Treponema sp.]